MAELLDAGSLLTKELAYDRGRLGSLPNCRLRVVVPDRSGAAVADSADLHHGADRRRECRRCFLRREGIPRHSEPYSDDKPGKPAYALLYKNSR
ncbi:hypothetical protein OH799_06980 [Nocardia sp. NBC_00881]|uniref:hypothetical protein n=1 Tax=Nocardia sp. NBC_00881 TaxID=2975995 RepID=UPI003868C889|nr:hypothetical protein OH799_06980 [Nocardia sp. NBC_00881]